MIRDFFKNIESEPHNSSICLTKVIEHLAFNERGLIPVITQDAKSKAILMFAWMNKEALEKTISTQRMTYWSRSRQKLWIKGETSGHSQILASMAFDCDGDAVLCQVYQSGAACDTGRPDCFYLKVDTERQQVIILGDSPS